MFWSLDFTKIPRVKFVQESSQSFWIQKNKGTHGKFWQSFHFQAVNTDHRSCSQEGILNANTASKTVSYSKQNPLESLWMSTSLNMSCGDKRMCHCQFVRLCLETKQPQLFTKYERYSTLNMMSHSPQTQTPCHREQTGRPQPPNKQAGAQQRPLLTVKLIQSEFRGQEGSLSGDIATAAAWQ